MSDSDDDGGDPRGWGGWEDAMQEVAENEYSERAERMIPLSTPRGANADMPPAIIESVTIDSAPLIQLTTLESDKTGQQNSSSSSSNEEDEAGTSGSWLDVAASSSSKGSQGSYADQVPALLGSGSALDPVDVTDYVQNQAAPGAKSPMSTSSPPPHSDPVMVASMSPGGKSLYDTPSDEAFGISSRHPIPVEDVSSLRKDTKYLHDILGGAGGDIYTKNSTGIEDVLGPKDIEAEIFSMRSKESEGVDDILGPKDSEGVDDILGPKGKALLPSPDSIDEFLASPANRSDHETSQVFGSPRATEFISEVSRDVVQTVPSACTADHDDSAMERIVQSLGEHRRAQNHPSHKRLLIGPKDSALSHDSTLSRSDSQRDYDSVDNTFSEDATSMSRPSKFFPNPSAFSPTSQSQVVYSGDDSLSPRETETYHTYSYGDSTFSRVDSADPSFLSNQTGGTGRTGTVYTDYTNQSMYTETDASMTEYNGPSQVPSRGSVSAVDSNGTGFFTAIERAVASKLGSPMAHDESSERGGASPSQRNAWENVIPVPDMQLLEDVKTNTAGLLMAIERAVLASPMAQTFSMQRSVASPSQSNTLNNVNPSLDYGHMETGNDRQSEKKHNKITQSLMAKTRSRAETNAAVTVPSARHAEYSKPVLIKVEEELNERFIRNTALARKRVSVVQLLVVGLMSVLLCFIGSIGIQASCHFVSADVQVGETDKVYKLHYGLWKFSPIGSAFQGYPYCDAYHEEFGIIPPNISRFASLIAFLGGSYAVVVLWWYLIMGQATRSSWYSAVNLGFLSALLHGASLLIFTSPICDGRDCELGPAGVLSVAASAMSFVLAFEMYYNSPIASWSDDVPPCPEEEEPRRMIQALEMTHVEESALEYCKRLIPNAKKDIPTLNQFQRKKEDHNGEGWVGRDSSRQFVYSPPAIV